MSTSNGNTQKFSNCLRDASGAPKDPLVWVDLEMTGLDIDGGDTIIEVACLITDGDLNFVDEKGFHMIVNQPKEVMDGMGEWCREHHGKSGLTTAVLESPHSLSHASASLLAYIKSHIPTQRLALLAGNSVHADRVFLSKYMPEVVEWLHYRIVDVSTVKELARRWEPRVFKAASAQKGEAHRALDDIKESVQELMFYRENWMTPNSKRRMSIGGL
ncbi:Oligoribonuclease, mitochondrial [Saitoella coloradoensis]